jgi:hypothetical protein
LSQDPFPDFSARFPAFCVGDGVRIRHLRVRILLGQPASAVSTRDVNSFEKLPTFPTVGQTTYCLYTKASPLPSEIFAAVSRWAAGLIKEELCESFSFDTYDREIEQYGGLTVISAVESALLR